MLSGLYTALTGMNVSTLRAEVAARNIVNSLSSGSDPGSAPLASEALAGVQAYQPQRVAAYSLPGGGVGGRKVAVNPATYPVYDPSNAEADETGMVQFPNVSLESEMAQLTLAVTSYKASATVLKTIDETMGTLLDRKS